MLEVTGKGGVGTKRGGLGVLVRQGVRGYSTRIVFLYNTDLFLHHGNIPTTYILLSDTPSQHTQHTQHTVGAIIGRRGEIIVKVQQLLGVKIFVSSRSEQPTADSERTVTVTGPPDAVQLAEALLQQKLRAWNAPGGGTNNPSGSGGGAADDGLF